MIRRFNTNCFDHTYSLSGLTKEETLNYMELYVKFSGIGTE